VCSYISADHRGAHLLYRDFLSAYLLFHSRIIIKSVLSAFWEPGEYITDVQSAWVTHEISWLNMWTIYQIYHLFPLFLSFTLCLHPNFVPPTFCSYLSEHIWSFWTVNKRCTSLTHIQPGVGRNPKALKH